jgi:hypothetical protein
MAESPDQQEIDPELEEYIEAVLSIWETIKDGSKGKNKNESQ